MVGFFGPPQADTARVGKVWCVWYALFSPPALLLCRPRKRISSYPPPDTHTCFCFTGGNFVSGNRLVLGRVVRACFFGYGILLILSGNLAPWVLRWEWPFCFLIPFPPSPFEYTETVTRCRSFFVFAVKIYARLIVSEWHNAFCFGLAGHSQRCVCR